MHQLNPFFKRMIHNRHGLNGRSLGDVLVDDSASAGILMAGNQPETDRIS